MIGVPYNSEAHNCATTVCEWYRQKGMGNIPNGDLLEYTHNALYWIKNFFRQIDDLQKDCLIVVKNIDGSLHVAIFDGKNVIHASREYGQTVRQPLWMFKQMNSRLKMRYFKWRD